MNIQSVTDLLLIFAVEAALLGVLGIVYFFAMKRARWLLDSPWFWAMIFTGIAFNNMVLIGPKYEKREAGVELRYLARQRAVPNSAPEINGGGAPTAEELQKDARISTAADQPPTELIVSHDYLGLIIGAACVGSAIMLIRQILNRREILEPTMPSEVLRN